MSERFSRNEALFGAEGQRRIARSSVAIVGLGGLGSHVAQQLAYLGTARFCLLDHDVVSNSSLNRVVTAVDADVAAATPKTVAAERVIRAIAPAAQVARFEAKLSDASDAIATADLIVGCVDRDTHRLELLEIAAEARRPYLDLATDTGGEGRDTWYGGRTVLSDGEGCLVCLPEILDQEAIARDRMAAPQREARDRSYGVSADALEGTGPAVVSLNGVVASLGVTELMCLLTGLRAPQRQLIYRADQGIVLRSRDSGDPECFYCSRRQAA